MTHEIARPNRALRTKPAPAPDIQQLTPIADMHPYVYDYDEASLLTGLAPETIREYCKQGQYGLTRGTDWIVKTYRHGAWQRRVRLLLEPGIRRLQLRGMMGSKYDEKLRKRKINPTITGRRGGALPPPREEVHGDHWHES